MSKLTFALPLPPAPADAAPPWRQLAPLGLLVLAAHWGLLGGFDAQAWKAERPALAPQAFETRTLTLPPAPAVRAAETQTETPAPPRRKPAAPAPAAPPPEPAATAATVPPDNTPPPPEPDPAPTRAYAAAAAGLAAEGGSGGAAGTVAIPKPMRMKYDVKGEASGIPYRASGELLWDHDGRNYNARLEISIFLLGSRSQTSKGLITPEGLAPTRFGDKVRSEVAAHFEREKGKVSFSANTPDVALEPGAQDNLSVFVQVAALLGANNGRFPGGSTASFQTIGPRSAETWVFRIVEQTTLKLPGGDQPTVKVTRDAVNENDAKAEMWLAPALGYLPVRIRLSQPNGDFVDQLWRSTQNP